MKILELKQFSFYEKKKKKIKKEFNFNKRGFNNVIIEKGKSRILSPFYVLR